MTTPARERHTPMENQGSRNKTLYTNHDWERLVPEERPTPAWRSAVARDYARIIHSACFRRLQGKTQVFPGHESDFFRNRLTHSLEVAQIAQSIAAKINHEYSATLHDQKIDEQLCFLAGLIHDLGHPPFGHNGERALDRAMLRNGGFEGNAQSLRILTSLEKKIPDAGLNLTWRSLACALKYDKQIPTSREESNYSKPIKGYYQEEANLVHKMKVATLQGTPCNEGSFKTLECSIMDVADDIAYSTYDLEDCLKAGFLTPAGILASNDRLLKKVSSSVSSGLGKKIEPQDILATFVDIFNLASEDPNDNPLVSAITIYTQSHNIASSSYFRTNLTSQLVNEFIEAVTLAYNADAPMLSTVKLSESARVKVETLKRYTYEATIDSSRVKLAEYRGADVVGGIFKALSNPRGALLMPDDVRETYESADPNCRPRIICDFVSGMTDRYALEFYARLNSDSAQSMFKPI